MSLTQEEENLLKLLEIIDYNPRNHEAEASSIESTSAIETQSQRAIDLEFITQLQGSLIEDEGKTSSNTTQEETALTDISSQEDFVGSENREKRRSLWEAFVGIKSYIGLDIGSSSIKYVELIKSRKGWVLKDFGRVVLPTKAVDAGDQKRILIEAIEKALPPEKLKSAWVSVSLPGGGASLRRLFLPKMPKKELKESLFWACKKELPFPVEEVIFDYHIMDEIKEDSRSKLEILVAVAQRNIVEARLSFLKDMKITPHILTTVALALWNILLQSPSETEGKCVVMVDIGAENTTMVFVDDGKAVFAREIGIGGNVLTEALTGTIFFEDGQISLNPKEAENVKINYGMPLNNSSQKVPPGIPLGEIAITLRPALERLLGEIQRSLEYYRGKFPPGKIDRIYLCGGTACLKNIATYFSEGLGVEVQVYDPLKGFKVGRDIGDQEKLKALAPQLTVALGIAVSSDKRLNLLPEELKKLPFIHLQKRLLVYSTTLVLLLLPFCSGTSIFQSKSLEGELKRLQAEYSRMLPRRETQLDLKTQITSLQKKKALYSSLLKNNRNAIVILKALSHLIPENIVLTKLDLQFHPNTSDNKKGESSFLYLQGVVTQSDSKAGVSLADFVLTLSNSGLFSAIDLKRPIFPVRGHQKEGLSYGKVKSSRLSFDILCQF